MTKKPNMYVILSCTRNLLSNDNNGKGRIMNESCIFCKIANKAIPSEFLFENDDVCAFRDVNPQAPTHILIIPKKHIPTIMDIPTSHIEIVSKMFEAVQTLAKQFEIDQSGFRLVMNCNEDGGQSVYHIHFHLLGKRKLAWPPG